MNKYESYLDAKRFNEQVKCLEDAEDYLKEYYEKQRFYLNTKLAGMFEFILKRKEYEENPKAKPKYSDSDIEFLKQFDVMDLTHHEAFILKKAEEHYKLIMAISYRLSFCSPKVVKAVQDEADRLDENYTPRILIKTLIEANKK